MIEKTSIRASHIFTFLYHVIMCASIFPAKKNFMALCERIFNDIRDTIRKPHPGNISNDKRQNMCITVAFILPIKKKTIYFWKILDLNYGDRLSTKSLFRWNAQFESVVGFPGSKYFLSSVESSTKRPLGSFPRRRIAGKPASTTNDAPQVFKLRTRVN